MVALLRGVNVGGATRLPMADLRRAAEACGYLDVRTYVQSGNVVLRLPRDHPTAGGTDAVAASLRRSIAERTAVRPDVVVRTTEELRAVLATNPFLDRSPDPTHHHVVFLDGPASLGDVDPGPFAPEDAVAVGREVYLFLPGGIGRSKLAAVLSRRATGTGTARNWRTVTKLAGLADELERPGGP
jgi:uncharacterized protein (DUF1697 family)